jgi:hypothetical protein
MGCAMTDMSDAPDWWTERGERDEAQRLASRLRHFIADSRLMSPIKRRAIETAQIHLDAHLTRPEPTQDDEFWHGLWWVPDAGGGLRTAKQSECTTEIKRLRALLAQPKESPHEADI